MKKKKFLLPALLMAACLALGGGLLTLDTTASAAEDSAVAAYCPDGSENVSLGKSVTVSSAYNMPNEGWSPAFLTDGSIGTLNQQPPNGWSTAIHETDVSTTPAWATVDLGGEYSISCIVLFPRRDLPGQYGESFPVGFRLEVSATGAEGSWKTVKEFTDLPRPTEPLVIDVTEATNANFVRLYVTKRTGVDDTSGGEHNSVGKLVQVSEMAVFGKLLHAVASLDRPALELAVGSSDTLKVNVSGMDAPAFTWTSDDASVASVDADGKVTANAVGKTVVRVSGEGIEEQTANISVVDKKYDFDENITISVFWLPTTTYLNGGEGDERWDEQFKLLADADIDWLANVTDNDNTGMLIHTKEDNMKAAEYAAKYGMHLTVADTRFGRNLLTMTDEQITSLIEEYRNVPGVGGYYLWDEPGPSENLATFARAYAAMKKADPSAYTHLNFLPMWAYTGGNWQTAEQPYRDHVGSWLDATNAAGVEQDFIMYDLYPYTGFGTGMMRDEFFSHLDVMRRIGLEYGVKTATYLQSNGGPSKRSPSPAEIRYQAMTSLAYGYKQLSYFTWFLPTNRGETFNDAIVSDEGVPNPKTYDAVSALNKEIHNLGKTLIRLDSIDVHLNGEQWGGQTAIPADFLFQPMDDVLYTITYMKDKTTGRGYVMVVNNDFTKPMETSFFINGYLPTLQRVDPATGDLVPVEVPSDKLLTLSLEAGDAILYALPEGIDYTSEVTLDKAAANAMLARAESEKAGLSAADKALLESAVADLKDALFDGHVPQSVVDELTARIGSILENVEKAPADPSEEEGGCGAVAFRGGGIAVGALLLAAAAAAALLKRKE